MQWPWSKAETELDREMRYHLETLADGFERAGMSRREAMQRARREFGGVDQMKEQCRDERRWRPLAQLTQDLGFGVRMLRKAPAVTAAAVLSLALGIGATTAILSLIDAVLWRQLAVPHPEQVTEILWQSKKRLNGLYQNSSGSMYGDGGLRVADFFSRDALEAMRERTAGRAEVAAHRFPTDISTSYAESNAVARMRPVSGNFFPMLGLNPFAGRLLGPADDDPAAPLAVVVSHVFWESQLKGDYQAPGRQIRINNHLYTIAGVLPAEFGGLTAGEATDVYTTLAHAPDRLDQDGSMQRRVALPTTWSFQLLARRLPGLSEEAFRPLLDAAFRSSWVAQPKDAASAPSVRVQSAAGGLGSARKDFGDPLALLMALVALVLLIACANIANLLLARADTRRKEVALRISLGCSRARLIRQFFTESVLLGALGALFSLLVAYATANFAVTLMADQMRLAFAIDGSMLAITAVVTAVAVLVFGLYPAWRATRVDAAPALKEGAGSVGGAHQSWLAPGKLTVLGQVALGVLLLTAAATFNAHLRKIVNSDAGFDRANLMMFDLRPGQSGYQGERLRQFYLDLEQQLPALPGIKAAGIARVRPMKGYGYYDDLKFAGGKSYGAAVNFTTADYLRALGVRIVAGRGITASDVRSGARVAVISEDLARKIGSSAVGLTFTLEDPKQSFQVVGVASAARYGRLTDKDSVLYLPNGLDTDTLTVVLRTAGPPAQSTALVRDAVRKMDRNLPIVGLMTMEDQIAATLRRERLFAWLCGAFGVLALVLCMVGLYGVMSYATTRRRQEIGIRMALGAAPGDVLRHVVGEGMGLASYGLLIGAPGAYLAAWKYFDYKRLGLEPLDPAIIGWAVAALAASALLAVLGPAWRAASADPVKALRQG